MVNAVRTFVCTDVEGSSELWFRDQDAMAASLEVHDRILSEAFATGGGSVFTTAGDSFWAAFERSETAVATAREIHARLASARWPGPPLRVRIGIHRDQAQARGQDWFGPTLNLTARLADAGHGGQTLVSESVRSELQLDATDLGLHVLDVQGPVRVYQVGAGDFPALRLGRKPPAAEVAATASSRAEVSRFRFGRSELNLSTRELAHDGELVHLEPQVFDVLSYLVVHRDRLVSREELLDEIWGDQFVSLSALTSRVKSARRAIGDDGTEQRYIRTERGRGYRFVGEIEGEVPVTGAPPRPMGAGPGREEPLPQGPPRLVGREADLDAISELVGSAELLTVAGPGGVGKTTIALEVAREWRDRGDGPVAFVALDTVRRAEDVGRALATALRVDVPDDGDVVQAAAEYLATSTTLVVIDNCEHLLEAAAELIDALLRSAPGTIILATSREPLGLRAERVFRLSPLGVDGSADSPSEAADLFSSIAARTVRDFRLNADNAPAVDEICRRLDGLPLGLELAAGRLATLGLDGLVARVVEKNDPGSPRRRDLDERHSSLAELVDWSFDLLSTNAQRLHMALAAFPAGLDLESIERVAEVLGLRADADHVVAELVDCSMVLLSEMESGARFTMLETLRAYGVGRLAQSDDRMVVRAALAKHASHVAKSERQRQMGRDRPRWFRYVRNELANLRAARAVLQEDDDIAALVELSVSLMTVTAESCLAEPWEWTTGLLKMAQQSGAGETAVAGARLLAAAHARNHGRYDDARRHVEAMGGGHDEWLSAHARHEIAMADLFTGDFAAAADNWTAAHEAAPWWSRGLVLAALGLAYAGDLDQAIELLAEGERQSIDGAPAETRVNARYVRGEIQRLRGEPGAEATLRDAIAVGTAEGLEFSTGVAQVSLVSLLADRGDRAAAAPVYGELIERWLRSSTWPQLWTTLRNAASALAEGHPPTALLIWEAATHDPQAPALDEDAAADIAARMASVRMRLDERTIAGTVARAKDMPRTGVAEAAMVALADLASSESA